MIRIVLTTVVAVACSTTLVAQNHETSYQPGDQVVVIDDANLRVPGAKVDDVWPGLVLKVTVVSGKWLWVSHGKPGWLDSAHVVPLDRSAVDRLTELIRAQPTSARLFSGRAAVWRHLGQLDNALADCGEAIRLYSQSAEYYNNRGYIWNENGDHDKAIADFNEALKLDPNHAVAYDNRGTAWEGKGEYDKALADHSTAIRLDSKNAYFYNNRGNVWNAKGDYDKAIEDFNQAVRLDPQDAVAYNNRGNARYFKKEYEKALADYAEALRLDPKNAVAYNSRAVLRATCADAKYRDGKQAIEDATKACELTEWKDAQGLDTLAAAYAEAGDFAKAIECQTKAIDLAPEDQKAEFRTRLELYHTGKPYREEKN
jgi:tetratricopeptide (TPR) repeat protein